MQSPNWTDHSDRSLLIVEDDKPVSERGRAPWKRGFSVTSCESVSDGSAYRKRAGLPVVDLRLGDGKASTSSRR